MGASATPEASLLDEISDGLIISDRDWRITFVNATAARYLARDPESLLGKNIWEEFPAPFLQPEVEVYKKAMRDQVPVTMDTYYQPLDAWMEVKARPIKGGFAFLYRDITVKKRSKEALRATEERLKLLADHARDMIYRYRVTEPRGFEYVSQGSVHITGYTPEELYANPAVVFKNLHPRDRAIFTGLGGKWETASATLTVRFIRKDGSVRWHELNRTPIYDADGRLAAIEGITRDVTDRMEAEEKLQASEERFRLLAENAQDMIYQFRLEPRQVDYCSPAIERITGYTPEEFYTDPDLIGKIVHPDDRDVLEKIKESARTRDQAFTVRLIRKDGKIVWVESSRVPVFDDGGRVVALQVIGRDVTKRIEQEQQERKQRTMLDHILATTPSGVAVLDEKCQIMLANKAFRDMVRRQRLETAGVCFEELFPAPEVLKTIQEARRTGRRQEELEFCQVTENGERHYRANVAPLEQNALGDHPGNQVFVSLRDITEEYLTQKQVERANLLGSVGEMAVGIAHELNNPLTSILGNAEILEGNELPPETEADIRVIKANAQRAAKIVRRLLDFARPKKPDRQLVNLNDCVRKVLDLGGYDLKKSSIQVVTDLAADLPPTMADPSQVEQVFVNVVLNAEQAMAGAHGQGTLTIKTERRGTFIRALFIDDGPGIAEEHFPRLFSPFFTTKEPGKGTGLGLSISHRIVTEHGGRIYAARSRGPGATFVVELPEATAGASPSSEASSEPPEGQQP